MNKTHGLLFCVVARSKSPSCEAVVVTWRGGRKLSIRVGIEIYRLETDCSSPDRVYRAEKKIREHSDLTRGGMSCWAFPISQKKVVGPDAFTYMIYAYSTCVCLVTSTYTTSATNIIDGLCASLFESFVSVSIAIGEILNDRNYIERSLDLDIGPNSIGTGMLNRITAYL